MSEKCHRFSRKSFFGKKRDLMKILYDEPGSIIVKISIVIRALYAAPMPSVVIYDRCITRYQP